MSLHIPYRSWFAADACRMAGVSPTDMRNWRARSAKWGEDGRKLFDRSENEGWQRFDLQQIARLAILGETAAAGIPLELGLGCDAAAHSALFRAKAFAAGRGVKTPASGPENGSWNEGVRWLVALQPAREARDLFYSHSPDPETFPAWALNDERSTYALIDLQRVGRRIVENAPEKSSQGLPGGISDVLIQTAY